MTNRQERIEGLEKMANQPICDNYYIKGTRETSLFSLEIIKDLQEEIKKLNDLVDLFSKERLS